MNVIDAISEVLPSFLKSAKKTIKLEEISTLDKEKSVLISRCETLKTEVLHSSKELDEVVFRKFIEENDLKKLSSILESVKQALLQEEPKDEEPNFEPKFAEDGIETISVPLAPAFLRLEFQCFVDLALKAIVEIDSLKHLKIIINWINDVMKDGRLGPPLLLKRNTEAMMRVIRRKQLAHVDLFFADGYRITSSLAFDFIKTKKSYLKTKSDFDNLDISTELELLSGMASPVYILAEAKYRSVDPVRRAFGHLHTAQILANTKEAFTNKLENMIKTLEAFIVSLLGACNTGSQVELFLEQDDNIEGLSTPKNSNIKPRINQALQLNMKSFVTHDHCQQALEELIYDEAWLQVRDRGFCAKFWYCIMEFLLVPWFAFWFIIAKFKTPCCGKGWWKERKKSSRVADEGTPLKNQEDPSDNDVDDLLTPCQRWANNLKVPVNRLICGTGFYFVFLFWILLTFVAPNLFIVKISYIQIDLFDLLAGIWALGYIFSDLDMMVRQSMNVKLKKGADSWEIGMARFKKFFSNGFLIYKFLCHFLYFLGLIVEYVGYYYQGHHVKYYYDSDCTALDPEYQESFTVVDVGICLQGVGIVLIFAELLQILRMNVTIGSLYVAIGMCFNIVMSFIYTYIIITFAFTLGLNFIMRHSPQQCDDNGNPIPMETCLNETLDIQVNETMDGSNNQFFTVSATVSTLFWSLFDAGNPDAVGCSEGVIRYTALILWGVYQTIMAIILLNLLIAMMNGAMDEMTTNKINSWKYNSTQVWVDYCNSNILPAPLNLFDVVIDAALFLLYAPCKLCCKEAMAGCDTFLRELSECCYLPTDYKPDLTDYKDELKQHIAKIKRHEKYLDIIRTVTIRHSNELACLNGGAVISQEEDSSAAEPAINVEAITREFKRLTEEKNEEIRKEIQELRWTIAELLEKAKLKESPRKD